MVKYYKVQFGFFNVIYVGTIYVEPEWQNLKFSHDSPANTNIFYDVKLNKIFNMIIFINCYDKWY